MSVKEVVQELVMNPKTAHVTATITAGTGLGTILDLIPNDIGKLATVVGIVLSIVLIRNHWRKGRVEYTKIQLENQLMRQQIAEREEAALIRKAAGLPVRRGE